MRSRSKFALPAICLVPTPRRCFRYRRNSRCALPWTAPRHRGEGGSMRFTDKAAIVTGAASGLGLAIATRLASEGCAVAVADANEAGAAKARDGILAAG